MLCATRKAGKIERLNRVIIPRRGGAIIVILLSNLFPIYRPRKWFAVDPS